MIGRQSVDDRREGGLLRLESREDAGVLDLVMAVKRSVVALPFAPERLDLGGVARVATASAKRVKSRRRPWCDSMIIVAIDALPSSLRRVVPVAMGPP
jgi:hypothetical protein